MAAGISAAGWGAIGVGAGLLLGGGDAPSPDPAIGQAANANAKVAADTLQWYKDKDAEMKPFRDEATRIALDQARTQVDTAKKQNAMADETYDYTKSTFRPLEQKIATDALGYDTSARRDAEAAQAQADVGTAADAARTTMLRDIEARGGDVNSGSVVASLANAGVREAAVKAGAGNQARKNVEAVGAAKLADAANLGRGIATSNATQTQLGLQAGNSAVNNAQAPISIDATRGGQMAQGAGTAISGNSSAGNLLLGEYNAQSNASHSNDALYGALGNVAGRAAAAWISDKNQKTGRKKISDKAALAKVKKLPQTETWRYRKDSPADDGGKPHTGNMAQDVNRVMGEEVAPGGTMVNLEAMSGTGLAAIRAVDKKQQTLERRVAKLENAKRKA